MFFDDIRSLVHQQAVQLMAATGSTRDMALNEAALLACTVFDDQTLRAIFAAAEAHLNLEPLLSRLPERAEATGGATAALTDDAEDTI